MQCLRGFLASEEPLRHLHLDAAFWASWAAKRPRVLAEQATAGQRRMWSSSLRRRRASERAGLSHRRGPGLPGCVSVREPLACLHPASRAMMLSQAGPCEARTLTALPAGAPELWLQSGTRRGHQRCVPATRIQSHVKLAPSLAAATAPFKTRPGLVPKRTDICAVGNRSYQDVVTVEM